MDVRMRIDPTVRYEPGKKSGGDRGQIDKAAEQFESFLIFSMLKELEKATYSTKKSYAGEAQMSLFYEKVGDILAKKGIGIKEMIARYAQRGG